MSVDATDSTPNYRQLSDEVFERRIADLRERYADCDLCAYECYFSHWVPLSVVSRAETRTA